MVSCFVCALRLCLPCFASLFFLRVLASLGDSSSLFTIHGLAFPRFRPALAPPNFTHPTQFTHRREDADSETSSADGDSVGSSPEEDGAERPSDSMKHEPRYRSAAVQAELDADVDNPEDAVDV